MLHLRSIRSCAFLQRAILSLSLPILAFGLPATATITITSPAGNSSSISAVRITATAANEGGSFDHLEIWDVNGSNVSV